MVSKFPASELDDSIVAAARKATGEFFGTTIEALSLDVQALLKKNGASAVGSDSGAKAFTVEMVNLLTTRLRATMPPGGSR